MFITEFSILRPFVLNQATVFESEAGNNLYFIAGLGIIQRSWPDSDLTRSDKTLFSAFLISDLMVSEKKMKFSD